MSQSLGDDRGLNVTQPMTFGTCKGFGMTWYIWYDHGGVLGVLDTRRLSSNTCTNFGNNVLSLSLAIAIWKQCSVSSAFYLG